jgi:hypothetical protein
MTNARGSWLTNCVVCFSLSPAPTHLPLSQISQPSSLVSVVNKAPTNGVTGGDSPHDYERLAFFQPSRPAPRPPGAIHSTYATLAAYSGKILLCVCRIMKLWWVWELATASFKYVFFFQLSTRKFSAWKKKYVFSWVIPQRLNFICRRFGTLFIPSMEDGTDRVFLNVGIRNSDAGELPRRKHTAYRTRRKFEIKNKY